MKFLFELASSCYIIPTKNEVESSLMVEEIQSVSFAVSDDPSIYKKKKTVEKVSRSNSTPSHWRPSLPAISEDKIAPVITTARRKENTMMRSNTNNNNKQQERKSVSKPKSRSTDNRENEFRRSRSVIAVPTFTPTAFFF